MNELRKRPRILIVDDEEVVTDSLRLLFEKEGYDVLATDNGQSALEMIQEHRPDCVLLDLIIQQMDGLAVLQEIRNRKPELGEVPVIIMTVVTQDSELADGFWMKATETDGFFTKPFDPYHVLENVGQVLKRKGVPIPE